MGALDRLQTYHSAEGYHSSIATSNSRTVQQGCTSSCSSSTSESSEYASPDSARASGYESTSALSDMMTKNFDPKTPLGYFMTSLHNMGFKVVENYYVSDDGKSLSEVEYVGLSVTERQSYKIDCRLTEFAEMLMADGNVLAISSAGSGKTTALTFKIMKDILTGESTKPVTIPNGSTINVVDNIFVGTFLKTGADELKKSLETWQRKMGYFVTADRVHFGTLHAEFKRALNEMGVATPIAKPKDLKNYLKKAVDGLGIRRVDGSALTFDDYNVIEGVLAYYRNRLDGERYNHPACDEYSLPSVILDSLFESYQGYKHDAGVMDFEDLQELLYRYLYTTPNPNVQNFIANRYNYIYLDEFQDTSQIQYAIIKFYARGKLEMNKNDSYAEQMRVQGYVGFNEDLHTAVATKGKLVCIGDDDQAIYSWRGSDVSIISRDCIIDFQPKITKLSVNYRCPENILMPVVSSITKNVSRYPKQLKSSRSGGEFNAVKFRTLSQMAKYLLKGVDADISAGKSVAIICRTNFDGMIPAMMLEKQHKYRFSISSDAMSLNSPLAKSILEVACLLTERSTNAVKRVLSTLVPYWAKYKVDDLVNTLRNDDNVNKRTSLWNIDENDLNHSVPELYNLVCRLKSFMFEENEDGVLTDVRVAGGDVSALKYLYLHLASTTYAKRSAYCDKVRAYIDSLVQILDTGDYESVHDFLNGMNTLNERLQARIKMDKADICIVTVHEFKGKERDSTYVWNDSEDVFPTTKTDLTNKAQVEEERRVHYIACTRAREKSTIMTISGKQGIFFREMSCSATEGNSVEGSLGKNFKENYQQSSSLDSKEVVADNSEITSKKVSEMLDGVPFKDELDAEFKV